LKYLRCEKADLCLAIHLETVLKMTTSYRDSFTETKVESIFSCSKMANRGEISR